MPIKQINSIRTDEFEYILKIDKGDDTEYKTLYQSNKKIKKWEIRYLKGKKDVEIVYENNKSYVTFYDSVGKIIEERLFIVTKKTERLVEKRIYNYLDGLLDSITFLDSSNRFLYKNQYYRTPEGRLRRIKRIYSDGSLRVSSYTYSRRNMVEEWHGKNESGDLIRYNKNAVITSRENWVKNRLCLREENYLKEDSPVLSITKNYKNNTTTRSQYNESGNIIAKKIFRAGKMIRDIEYIYEEDLIISKIRRSKGLWEKWNYEYFPDGRLLKKEYYKNGELKKITNYETEKNYNEELYMKGKFLMRIYYENDKKVNVEIPGEN